MRHRLVEKDYQVALTHRDYRLIPTKSIGIVLELLCFEAPFKRIYYHREADMRPVAARLLADTALVAILLFAAAGTLAWWRAWVLLAVMLSIRTVGAIAIQRISPALLLERAMPPMHADQPSTDRLLVLAVLATGFLGLPMIAALDVFRWHSLPRPAAMISASGLILFALGWSIKQLALRTNAFATTVLRMQHERAHTVADTGVYDIIRHPFYAADPLILVGLGLWLQSYTAALCAIVPLSLMVIRLHLEERFLRRELPGYDDYTIRVPHRLIPGIW
jgi:protein-S-isoprenylcysteine O-methyltransferase Ste14